MACTTARCGQPGLCDAPFSLIDVKEGAGREVEHHTTRPEGAVGCQPKGEGGGGRPANSLTSALPYPSVQVQVVHRGAHLSYIRPK